MTTLEVLLVLAWAGTMIFFLYRLYVNIRKSWRYADKKLNKKPNPERETIEWNEELVNQDAQRILDEYKGECKAQAPAYKKQEVPVEDISTDPKNYCIKCPFRGCRENDEPCASCDVLAS